jgi:tetratricopeptide (TPR) repeat protein
LAADNPAHRPDLARAVDHLGAVLDRVGRYGEALDAFQEAVGVLRELAADNPAHRPGFAGAVDNLGVALVRVGRYGEALDAFREAVEVWRELAADYPDLYGKTYHQQRAKLQRAYLDRGRPDDAIRLDL